MHQKIGYKFTIDLLVTSVLVSLHHVKNAIWNPPQNGYTDILTLRKALFEAMQQWWQKLTYQKTLVSYLLVKH